MKVFGIEVSTAKAVGSVFALVDGAEKASSEVLARIMGEKPTFEKWDAVRLEWRTGYAEQVGETVKAASIDRAWSRQAAALAEYGLEKPKSANPEAAKKAAQRANPFEGKTLEAVREEKEKLAEAVRSAPSPEVVKMLGAALEAENKLQKVAAIEKQKADKVLLQPRIDAMLKIIKAADGRTLALFEALIDATLADRSDDQKKAAWGVLMACAPGASKASKTAEKKAA
jgi:hypothetical protein